MALPAHKTKIICTIGPASESPPMLERMIEAGMNVARLNFSHGDFASHRRVIENIRTAARNVGQRVAIMADLSGPKMRIGKLAREPVDLRPGDPFTLTTESLSGDERKVSVSFPRLPQAVHPGDTLFLSDGLIQLEVVGIDGADVQCRVVVGGELRSRKGLNLPGIDLGIGAFTDYDRQCLRFGLEQGVEVFSQSFVENADDILAVRSAAASFGHHPFLIAKIERSRALDQIAEILNAADGIMIARGDLGVEMPIEQIAVVQKQLVRQANIFGKPVITATQMLESMTGNRRPTRAEATDVANAILDGTDCVMLSEESAMGKYPVEAVAMLGKIAAAVEPVRLSFPFGDMLKNCSRNPPSKLSDLIAFCVEAAMEHASPAVVIAPTHGGDTARSITRFRLPVWIIGVSSLESTCERLQLSYGIYPVHQPAHPDDWRAFAGEWLDRHGIAGNLVILTEGPSSKYPNSNNRVEIIDLSRPSIE